jgi:tetratricopeptide (TPR) repeat protein
MIFFHYTIKEVIRRSWFLYTGLLIGLAFLGTLVAMGGIIATGTTKVSFTPVQYWLTQAQVILHYVRLTLWPDSLCLDYGWVVDSIRNTFPSVIILFMILVVSGWLCYRRNPVGFLAAWFFAILAPTSLVPLIDPAWDYRMYLPSATLVILVAIAVYHVGNLASAHFSPDADFRQNLTKKIFGYTMMFLVLLMGILTYSRNLDYQTDISIWADTVRKRPQNARAHINLGVALMEQGNLYEAIGHLRQGINLESPNVEPSLINATLVNPYKNLGVVYLRLGNWQDAENYFRKTLQIRPDDAASHAHLGLVLYSQRKLQESQAHLQKALVLGPDDVDVHVNYGIVMQLQGNHEEAIGHFQRALKLRPDNINAMYSMGMTLYQLGHRNEAKGYFQKILAVMPENKPANDILMKLDKEQR